MSGELAAYAERAGVLFFFVSLAFILARACRARPMIAALIALLVATLLAIPYNGGLSTIDRFFSLSGPLGAASLVLLAIAVLRSLPGGGGRSSLDPTALAALVVILGVPYYWLELSGRTLFDPYTLGFADPLAPLALALLPFLFWRKGSLAVSATLALGGALFLLGAYASRNLFDYLIDPVAVVLALVLLIDAWTARRRVTRLPGGEGAPPR
ncbi:MAG: hypothetical protein IT535_01845 [Bauldia sp.]|nr:hypothetical protein [Bauldia sp.]